MTPILMSVIGMMRISTPRTYATWDPATKSAGITLSGGNLVASNTFAGMCSSTISKSSGKWYWEITNVGNPTDVGVQNQSDTNTASLLGGTANGWGYLETGSVYNNSSVIATYATYTSGNVLGFALDASAKTLAIYKNNSLQGTLTLTGTSFFAATGMNSTAGNQGTANFGATGFAYAPPAGFNAGLYT